MPDPKIAAPYCNTCRHLYARFNEGDNNVVPYHPAVLLAWGAHMNLQAVTDMTDMLGATTSSSKQPRSSCQPAWHWTEKHCQHWDLTALAHSRPAWQQQ
jgi:hypothetical protein